MAVNSWQSAEVKTDTFTSKDDQRQPAERQFMNRRYSCFIHSCFFSINKFCACTQNGHELEYEPSIQWSVHSRFKNFQWPWSELLPYFSKLLVPVRSVYSTAFIDIWSWTQPIRGSLFNSNLTDWEKLLLFSSWELIYAQPSFIISILLFCLLTIGGKSPARTMLMFA